MVGSLQPLPSGVRLPVPRRRILWPSPLTLAFRAPAGGFPVDSRRRQHSIAFNHIPQPPIPHKLEYPLGSRMHLVGVHPRPEARGRPFPRSSRSRSRVNLRVHRPWTRGPQGQSSPLRTPHGCPGVQQIFLTSRGRAPYGWPMVHQSLATGFLIPRGCSLALSVTPLSLLRLVPTPAMCRSSLPLPVTGPLAASHGVPFPRG